MTKGRQKRQMKLIEKEDARYVTFSKRRSGLFKKACELSALCAAETFLLVFSPAGKPFTFGHPSVDAILNRLANPNSSVIARTIVKDDATLRDVQKDYSDLLEQLEAEKKRGDMIKQRMSEKPTGLASVPIDELSLAKLERLHLLLTYIKENSLKRLEAQSVQIPANGSAVNPDNGTSSAGPHGEEAEHGKDILN